MVADKVIQRAPEPTFVIEDNIIVSKKPLHATEKRSISKLILDALSATPEFVGQIHADTGEKIRFAELRDRSIRCALWLQKQGIGPHDIVTIATQNRINDCVPFLAVYYVGAVFHPWYHKLTPDIIREYFDTYRPKVLFVCESLVELYARTAKELGIYAQFVVYGRHPEYPSLMDIMAEASLVDVRKFSPVEFENPAKQIGAIFFSSGTTGKQKGAMISYRSLANTRADQLELVPGKLALFYSSLSWITGPTFLVQCILSRATRVIHPEFHPHETCRAITRLKIEWVFFTPTMMTRIVKENLLGRYAISSLKVVLLGGSRTNAAILEAAREALPNALVSNTYGITELCGGAVRQTRYCKQVDSIGFLMDAPIQMKVIDPVTKRTLGLREKGELCFKVENPFMGYIDCPQEYSKMMDQDGWLHTGDLGYYDQRGEIMLLDRLKNVIIMQNHHVSPSLIENILMRHPAVKDVAVVPVPHSIDVERPLAFVVKTPEMEVPAEELIELPVRQHPTHRISGGVVFVDSLPMNSSGKKIISVLKEMAKAYAT